MHPFKTLTHKYLQKSKQHKQQIAYNKYMQLFET